MTVWTAGFPARFLPALLLLSACAAGTADPAGPMAVPAPEPVAATPVMAGPALLAPEPPPPPPPPEPKPVMGLDSKALSDLMGVPDFKRKDPPAEIWQYRAKDCILDIFLYGDGKGGPYTVAHLEILGSGNAPPVEKACLGGLQRVRR